MATSQELAFVSIVYINEAGVATFKIRIFMKGTLAVLIVFSAI